MKNYKCVTDLVQRLSNAADELISCANAYYSEEQLGPYRALISELQEVHGFGEPYIPLLIDMLKERSNSFEFEDIGDEIFAYRDQRHSLTQFFAPERLGELLEKTLEWIGENVSGSEFYSTLKKSIGMSDKEMIAAGYIFNEQIDPYTDAPRFTERMLDIPGIDHKMLSDWIGHAFGMAVIDEEEGVPQTEAREKMLDEFADAFERIEYLYGGTAEIFNYKAGYVPHELYGAVAFIAGGGDPDEAYEMAQNGAFEDSAEPDEDEDAGITMQ
jgi:hypothetical protein